MSPARGSLLQRAFGGNDVRAWGWRGALALTLAACSGDEGSGGPAPFLRESTVEPGPAFEPTLPVREVPWTTNASDIGAIAAIADSPEGTVVATDRGLFLFVGGALRAKYTETPGWRSVGTLPALVGQGTWFLGVDAEGRVQSLRSDGRLEYVAGRFGVQNDRVKTMANFKGDGLAFLADQAITVVDGSRIRRVYQTMDTATTDGVRIGGVLQGQALIWDAKVETLTRLPAEGYVGVVLGTDGRAVGMTPSQLYLEASSAQRFTTSASPAGEFHGLAVAGTRTWFAVGTELGVIEEGKVRITQGAAIDASAALMGSSTGDVWVLAQGKARRFSTGSRAGGGSETNWNESIKPIADRVCAGCHTGTPSSGILIASQDQWEAKRAAILRRVVEKQDMPPAASGYRLTNDERKTIERWALGQ